MNNQRAGNQVWNISSFIFRNPGLFWGPLGVAGAPFYIAKLLIWKIVLIPWQFFAILTQTKLGIFFLILTIISIIILTILAPALGPFIGIRNLVKWGILMGLVGVLGIGLNYKYNKSNFSKWRAKRTERRFKRRIRKSDFRGALKVISDDRKKHN